MHIYEKKSLKMTTLSVVFNAGSLYEKEGRFGTMHLMEHLICKSFDDLRSELTKREITWNACTGDEFVQFYWTGLDSQLTPALKQKLVSRVVDDIQKYVTKDAFNKENATVYQEYCDCFSDTQQGAVLNFFRKKFNYFNAIGKREDILNFTYEDMLEVKKEFFMKPARIIEVGPTKSDFWFVEYEDVKHEFAKLKYKNDWKAEQEMIPDDIKKVVVIGACKKAVKKADYPFLKVALLMLNKGLESPLYQEIREKRGLSYYSIADLQTNVNDSICAFYAATTSEQGFELKAVYDNFLSDIKSHLNKERFDEIMNAIEIAKEKRKIMRFSHITDLIRKGNVDMPKNMSKITYERVVEVAEKYLNNDNFKFEII